jgi:hypothetical protein
VRAAQELLGAPTMAGECLAKGWWWRESKKSNKPFKSPGMYENSAKTAGLPHVMTLKTPKTRFLKLKVLNKIYSRHFFEDYINFKNFRYLRRCGVIPVLSFGSHMRPKPPRLGLKWFPSLFMELQIYIKADFFSVISYKN